MNDELELVTRHLPPNATSAEVVNNATGLVVGEVTLQVTEPGDYILHVAEDGTTRLSFRNTTGQQIGPSGVRARLTRRRRRVVWRKT